MKKHWRALTSQLLGVLQGAAHPCPDVETAGLALRGDVLVLWGALWGCWDFTGLWALTTQACNHNQEGGQGPTPLLPKSPLHSQEASVLIHDLLLKKTQTN